MPATRSIPFQNPSIDLWGIRIDEPVTALTDILVAAVCFYAFWKLKGIDNNSKPYIFYKYFFLLMGIATFLGGVIGHGFNYALSIYWKIPGWYISMISIALAERGSIYYAMPLLKPKTATVWTWINIAELLFFMVISVAAMNFYFVVGHSAYGIMIVVGGFHAYIYYKTKQKAFWQILWAVGWSALAAVIFMNQLAPSVWFNHLDISHVLMALSAWHIYRAVLLFVSDPDYQLKG